MATACTSRSRRVAGSPSEPGRSQPPTDTKPPGSGWRKPPACSRTVLCWRRHRSPRRVAQVDSTPQITRLCGGSTHTCWSRDGFRSEQDEPFDFARDEALPDVLAIALASEAQRAFACGLLHGYRMEEDALQTIRGRIRLEDQMRRRPGFMLPVEVRYDEFTDDILENRLVKAAASRLSRMRLRSTRARSELNWVAGML
ncbi:MAG: hypothetical protein OXC06_16685, partial [Acidimicrobiaceae bacterium]|nr:hypothetical protein [Acidimicrobiaceae bacterium]